MPSTWETVSVLTLSEAGLMCETNITLQEEGDLANTPPATSARALFVYVPEPFTMRHSRRDRDISPLQPASECAVVFRPCKMECGSTGAQTASPADACACQQFAQRESRIVCGGTLMPLAFRRRFRSLVQRRSTTGSAGVTAKAFFPIQEQSSISSRCCFKSGTKRLVSDLLLNRTDWWDVLIGSTFRRQHFFLITSLLLFSHYPDPSFAPTTLQVHHPRVMPLRSLKCKC